MIAWLPQASMQKKTGYTTTCEANGEAKGTAKGKEKGNEKRKKTSIFKTTRFDLYHHTLEFFFSSLENSMVRLHDLHIFSHQMPRRSPSFSLFSLYVSLPLLLPIFSPPTFQLPLLAASFSHPPSSLSTPTRVYSHRSIPTHPHHFVHCICSFTAVFACLF